MIIKFFINLWLSKDILKLTELWRVKALITQTPENQYAELLSPGERDTKLTEQRHLFYISVLYQASNNLIGQ